MASTGEQAQEGRTSCERQMSPEEARRDAEHERYMAAVRRRTTKLYDRRNDQATLDQVERIVL